MRSRKLYLLLGLWCGFTLAFAASSPSIWAQGGGSQNYNYVPLIVNTIDALGAGTGALQGTAAKGVDAAGDVAGSFVDANGTSHGYVYSATNVMTTFDVPGASTGKKHGTFVTAMDPAGDVAGYYSDATSGSTYGFVRAANSTITTFIVSAGWAGEGTEVLGINSLGAVTGEDQFNNDAFVRSPSGTITSFSVTDPGTSLGYATTGIAINTAGVIAGRYVDSNGISHGFVRTGNGIITTFDPPGVATQPTFYGISGTIPTSIDTAGDIAGTYTDTTGARHSFVRTSSGTMTSFDPPGTNTNPCATTGMGVLLCGSGGLGMDDAMDIIGAYFDVNNVASAYLRYGANGAFATVALSQAGTSAFQGAGFFAINASGIFAGTYLDSNSMLHGFTFNIPIIATTTTLIPAPTPNPSINGEPILLTATVTSSQGTPPNGETVTFDFDGASWASAPLINGVASASTLSWGGASGTFSVTASYPGDSQYIASTSAPVNQVITPAGTSTALVSWLNPSTFGQSVTLVATISAQFGGLPTGSVAFNNESASLGSVSLNGSNTAQLTTSAMPIGTNPITAVYSGDSNFAGSTSTAVSQVVNGGPDFNVAATPASQTVTAGQNGTTSISITPANGFNSAVSFSCSGLPAGASCSFAPQNVTPSGGMASTTLTVTTSASMATIHRHASPMFPIGTLAALVCCVGWKKRRLVQIPPLLVVCAICLGLLNGCNGAGAGRRQPVTSTVTVVATSGSLQHSTAFLLTVN